MIRSITSLRLHSLGLLLLGLPLLGSSCSDASGTGIDNAPVTGNSAGAPGSSGATSMGGSTTAMAGMPSGGAGGVPTTPATTAGMSGSLPMAGSGGSTPAMAGMGGMGGPAAGTGGLPMIGGMGGAVAMGGAMMGGTAGMPAVGGMGGMGGDPGVFQLTIGAIDSHDNEDCSNDACATCEPFPPENISVCDNPDNSPAMSWTPGPAETESYAIVLVDTANDLTHWALWNIPATVTSIAASLPGGAPSGDLQGAMQASFSGTAYAGSGACRHVYEFRLYAVAGMVSASSAAAVRTELEASDAPLSFVRLRSDCPDGCTTNFGGDCTD